jgi:hypothetical protein
MYGYAACFITVESDLETANEEKGEGCGCVRYVYGCLVSLAKYSFLHYLSDNACFSAGVMAIIKSVYMPQMANIDFSCKFATPLP